MDILDSYWDKKVGLVVSDLFFWVCFGGVVDVVFFGRVVIDSDYRFQRPCVTFCDVYYVEALQGERFQSTKCK